MSVVGYDTLKALIVTCQGNIAALQTTVSSHTTQITNLGSDVDALKLRMTNAETAISTLQSGLSATNTNLTALTKRVTQAESDIDTAGADIDALESRCSEIEEKDTSQDSAISTLDGRCAALETNVTNNASKIAALTTRVSTAEGDIDNCESRLSAIEQSAVYNSGATKAKIDQIATNAADIDAIEQSAVYTSGATKDKIDQIATNQEQINALNTDLAAAEGDIDTLQSSVNELATGISNLGSRVSTVETAKQNKLTAGDNVTIEDDVISASGGSSDWESLSSLQDFLDQGIITIDGFDSDNNTYSYKIVIKKDIRFKIRLYSDIKKLNFYISPAIPKGVYPIARSTTNGSTLSLAFPGMGVFTSETNSGGGQSVYVNTQLGMLVYFTANVYTSATRCSTRMSVGFTILGNDLAFAWSSRYNTNTGKIDYSIEGLSGYWTGETYAYEAGLFGILDDTSLWTNPASSYCIEVR